MKARICAVTLSLVLAGSGQLSAESTSKDYKDPKTAMVWGYFLPGAGHLYAGESGRGLLVMGTSVGALIGGIAMTLGSGDDSALSAAEDSFLDQDFGAGGTTSSGNLVEETDLVPLYVGTGVFALGWIYSLVDAPKAAERTNQKSGLSILPGRVAPFVATRGGSTQYGLRLQVRL